MNVLGRDTLFDTRFTLPITKSQLMTQRLWNAVCLSFYRADHGKSQQLLACEVVEQVLKCSQRVLDIRHIIVTKQHENAVPKSCHIYKLIN